ncbi:hypothetical protein RBH29_15885 [Herbivorax sp. ANBcel31]|uniref:hypothetical protein n=1 Tax=Herbivorax sp. ANBcel31 TaxID=3069754 RepID=UPI0027B3DB6E|nr:hypothetical protein [Herbivorax sp. ANBcel31]MDQ2087910.1 hypothetical protein [Herbivorax sp. ANBcel31]
MWYFYTKFNSEKLNNLIEQVNGLFRKIFERKEYEYPDWMEQIKLKENFQKFKQYYEMSSEKEKTKLNLSFNNNIQIEKICKNEIRPITYDELLTHASNDFKNCIKILKSIQEYLYENLLKLKGFEETAGTLKKYYEMFYKETIKYVCPFCGLDNMLNSKDLYREAFDHYLPKSKYPFVSFLRENIFPICNTCNSRYKGDKDPKDYGKSFYPFASELNDCELSFEIIAGEIVKTDIDSKHFLEEIESWNRMFDIKDRINNFAEVNLNGWVSNVQEVMKIYKVNFECACNAEIQGCKPKMQDHKFVKKAILKAL